MKEVRYSTKAKKDLKRYRNDLVKMHPTALREIENLSKLA